MIGNNSVYGFFEQAENEKGRRSDGPGLQRKTVPLRVLIRKKNYIAIILSFPLLSYR